MIVLILDKNFWGNSFIDLHFIIFKGIKRWCFTCCVRDFGVTRLHLLFENRQKVYNHKSGQMDLFCLFFVLQNDFKGNSLWKLIYNPTLIGHWPNKWKESIINSSLNGQLSKFTNFLKKSNVKRQYLRTGN